jgi:hypothetical protein
MFAIGHIHNSKAEVFNGAEHKVFPEHLRRQTRGDVKREQVSGWASRVVELEHTIQADVSKIDLAEIGHHPEVGGASFHRFSNMADVVRGEVNIQVISIRDAPAIMDATLATYAAMQKKHLRLWGSNGG